MSGMNRQGVAIPLSQLRGSANAPRVEPGKVVGVLPVEYVAVQYGNAQGILIKEIWLKAGNDFFRAPDAEMFVSSLASVKQNVADQVRAMHSKLMHAKAASTESAIDQASDDTLGEIGDVDV